MLTDKSRPRTVLAAIKEQGLSVFEGEKLYAVKRQITCQAFANTLDYKKAGELVGVTAQTVREMMRDDQEAQRIVGDLLEKRMKRLMIDGDDLVLKMQDLADECKTKGKHKEAIAALRTIAEMTGLLGNKAVAPAKQVNNFNFGVRPEDMDNQEPIEAEFKEA